MTDLVRRGAERVIADARAARMAALAHAVATLTPDDPDAYLAVTRQQCGLGLHAAATGMFRQALARCVPTTALYRRYLALLRELNRTAEAIEIARQAVRLFPAEPFFLFKDRLALPVLYADSRELAEYRERFARGLRELTEHADLDAPASLDAAVSAIGQHVNFLLAYQGQNDRELQALWGGMAHRIMAAYRPRWSTSPPLPADGGRLRIGYVSAHLREHSIAKSHLAWLTELAPERFEVFAYHTGAATDRRTDAVRRGVAVFRHLPGDLDAVCQAITADRLHVLVFLDIGLDGRMTQLAALRLAPVQCTTWGHPMTSGLPTVDYFLSSDLMEPESGQDSYTETLVRLPGIGICYPRPPIPRPLFYRTRLDFGLRHDAVVYLSCQSPCKYLPQDDDLYPAIARLVPGAQFVFIARNADVRDALRTRLEKAFRQARVDILDRLVFVPHLDRVSYWNLNALSDIYLDTLEWSGCNSTLEAIACGLPVVTLPGRFMRGRHSAAILTQLGVRDTIASDKPHYVEIAARLALDPAWRNEVLHEMADGQTRIYGDRRSIAALERFYETVTRREAAATPAPPRRGASDASA